MSEDSVVPATPQLSHQTATRLTKIIAARSRAVVAISVGVRVVKPNWSLRATRFRRLSACVVIPTLPLTHIGAVLGLTVFVFSGERLDVVGS